MATKNITIAGFILNQKTKKGIANLKVEAWDRDNCKDDLVGSVVTDSKGRFSITLQQKKGGWNLTDRKPDIFFKVYSGDKMVRNTENSVHWNIETSLSAIVLEVDLSNKESFIVRGQVYRPDRSPVANMIVKAFDCNLRSEKLLGEIITDKEGFYEIKYSDSQFLKGGKDSADLIVRVYGKNNKLIKESQIIFKAKQIEIVNLIVPGEVAETPSEFDKLLKEIEPRLKRVSIKGISNPTIFEKLADLKQADINYLTGETNIESQRIKLLAASAVLYEKCHEFEIPPEVFYGFAREGLPTEFETLLKTNQSVLKKSLENAIKKNIIKLKEESQIILNRLNEFRIENIVGEAKEEKDSTLFKLLSLSKLSLNKNQKKEFFREYFRHTGLTETFWNELQQKQGFENKEEVNELTLTFEIADITRNHLPLIDALQQQRQNEKVKSLRDLVRLTHKDWIDLIQKPSEGSIVGFPLGTTGKDDTEKAFNYAKTLTRTLEDTFPNVAIAFRTQQDHQTEKKDLVTFLESSVLDRENQVREIPEFDFATTRIQDYLDDHADVVLKDVQDPKNLSLDLKSMQRIFKITPYYDEMRPLLKDGIHSAQSIVQLGSFAFIKKYGNSLGESRAAEIYDHSESINATSLALLTQYGKQFNPLQPEFLPNLPNPSEEDIPEWSNLFGSIDFCSCEHCQSVYGPAAYLVDILHFLHKKCPSHLPNKTAKDVLFDRRRDIGKIELSCANTNTLVPYVDLVNEILENTIFPQPYGTPYPQSKDGENSNSVSPEHVNADVYKLLGEKIFPWIQPFNMWAEEGKEYLDRLGIKRFQIAEAFSDLDRNGVLTDFTIARRYLGLLPLEWQIITDTDEDGNILSIYEKWEYWGYAKTPEPTNWINEISNVTTFLKKSELTYQDLLELLSTRFINPDPENREIDVSPQDACDTHEINLKSNGHLTDSVFNKIHRFIRFQRKTGWSITELDQCFTALNPKDNNGTTNLTGTFLLQLSHIKRLEYELNIKLVKLLSFWADIDTANYTTAGNEKSRSLYEKLFQNKAVLNSDEELKAFSPNPPDQQYLSDHISSILAILGISENDFSALRDALGLQDNLNDDPPQFESLRLENLSILYRHTLLAKSLKLSIPDLISFKTLLAFDPFDFAHTENTILFSEKVRKIKESGFSGRQLNYIYRQIDDPVKPMFFAIPEFSHVINDIVNEIKQINSETELISPSEDLLRTQLSAILDEDHVKTAMDFIDNIPVDNADNRTLVDSYFGTFLKRLSEDDCKKLLLSESLNDEEREKFKESAIYFILEHLMSFLRNERVHLVIKKIISEKLKLDNKTTEILLEQVISSQMYPGDPEKRLIDDFISVAATGMDPIQSYTLLYKSGMLINTLKLTDKEVAFLASHGSDFDGFDFNTIPVKSSDNYNPRLFKQLDRLADYVDLRNNLPASQTTLIDVFSASTSPDKAMENLRLITGLDTSELSPLTQEQLKNEIYLQNLYFRFELGLRHGIPISQLRQWGEFPLDPNQQQRQAQDIKNALKSKYDDDEWLEIARPIRDVLREKQRTALVLFPTCTSTYPGIRQIE